MRITPVLQIFFVCFFTSTFAANKIWTGTLSSDWNNTVNWQGGTPSNGDTVIIDAGNYSLGIAPVISSASVFVPKNITVQNGGTLTINAALTITGDIIVTLGSTLTTTDPTNSVVYFDGTTRLINTGTFTFANVVTNSGKTLNQRDPATINIKGSWTNNGGIFTANTNKVVFSGSGTQQINGTSTTQTFCDIDINKSAGTLTVGGLTTTLNTNNITFTASNSGNFIAPAVLNITQTTTASLTLSIGNTGVFTADSLITIYKNWTNNCGSNYFNPGTGLVKFVNGVGSFINGSSTTQTFYDLEIAKTAQSLTMGGNLNTLNVHNFTQTSYKFNDSALSTFNISGNFLHTSGTFVPCNNIAIAGNIIDNDNAESTRLTWGTTVTLNGSSAQTIGGTHKMTFNNLVINNTSSTGVTLQQPVSITTSLNLTDGYVYTDAINLVIVKDNATSTSGSANSFIDGPMKKTGNDPFVFPVGKSGVWARIEMVNDADFKNYDATTEFTCTYYRTAAPHNNNSSYLSAGIKYASYTEYWDLNRTLDPGSNAQCNVRLYWEDASLSSISDLSDLKVAHLSSTSNLYEDQGGIISASGNTGTITSTIPLTGFSPFSFGSGSGITPLPIELLSFDAIATKDNKVELIWSVASEVNNDYYSVERSVNGINYEEVAKVKGSGTFNNQQTYAATDEMPFSGVSYYRLKQTDFDGKSNFHKIVHVELTESKNDYCFYPNPLCNNEYLFLQTTSDSDKTVQLTIMDNAGKIVCSNKLLMKKEIQKIKITQADCTLSSGSYSIVLVDEEHPYYFKLIVN